MTYIPTTHDEVASTFNSHAYEKGALEWKTLRIVRGDHVTMYSVKKKSGLSQATVDAYREMLYEPPEDAYL